MPITYHFDYRIFIDREKGAMKIFSDDYSDSRDKSMREQFVMRFFSFLFTK